MPRAHLSKRLDDATAIQLFAEHHIVHVRRRKNGEIVAVKHSTFGWMSPEQYYALQKAHDFLPLIQEFIEGGYRVNAMIWGFNPSLSIVGIADIPIPVGGALLATAVWNLYQELTFLRAGQPHWERLLWVAWSVLGPFGAILQILDTIDLGIQTIEGTPGVGSPIVPAQLKPDAWADLRRELAKKERAPFRPPFFH